MKERPNNTWLSIGAYARTYGVTRNTVKKWLSHGLLESYKMPPATVRIKNQLPSESAPLTEPKVIVVAGTPRVLPAKRKKGVLYLASDPVPLNPGVYFIRSGMGVKIGYAANLQRRLQTLQIGSFLPLCVVGYIICPTKADALTREQALHKQFRDERVRGEWFRFTEAVVSVIRRDGRIDERALLVEARRNDDLGMHA